MVNKMETSNQPDKECKIMAIKMLTELKQRLVKFTNGFNMDRKCWIKWIKKYQSDLNNTIVK